MHVLNTVTDVRNWLFHLGEGHGLPEGAVKHLEPFMTFRRLADPNAVDIFKMVNSDGNVLAFEQTPHFPFVMRLQAGHYLPEEADIQLRVELPAVVFGYFDKGFDRTGDYEVAFFDITPVSQLTVPSRVSARTRMASVLNHVTPQDVERTPEDFQAICDWYNSADEKDVRAALTEHYKRDFTTDEALESWLLKFSDEFQFFYMFLKQASYEDLLAKTGRATDA